MATLTVREAEIALENYLGFSVTIIVEETDTYDERLASESGSVVEWPWNSSIHKVTNLPLPCIDKNRRIEVMFTNGTTASGFAEDWSKEWDWSNDHHITKWRYAE